MDKDTPAPKRHADAAAAADAGAFTKAGVAPGAPPEVVRLQAPQLKPEEDPAGRSPEDGAIGAGRGSVRGLGTQATGRDHDRTPPGRLPFVRKVTQNRWWRRNLGDNFSLEHELDAKIDRLRIMLSSLPETVVPAMDAALRAQLLGQLDRAGQLLDACEPFERVMQRLNFVEAEIMMRLADDHVDLALEALRAEATISLPETAGKSMLDEIDKVASSTDLTLRKVKILGLKARLGAAVIELFRGSERARDAIWMLGAALIALTCLLGWLFYYELDLQQALFTHYGSTVVLPAAPGENAATAALPGTGVQPPAAQAAANSELPSAARRERSSSCPMGARA
jgi:hypothetical protein